MVLKRIGATFAAAGIVIAVVGSSLPAFAVGPRALTSGDAMFAVSCESGITVRVYGVDPSNALVTQLGPSNVTTPATYCSQQPAWDASTNTAYVIVTPNGLGPYYLASFSTINGAITQLSNFTYNAAPMQPDSLAIAPDGSAFATLNGTFYNVDLSTGFMTNPRPTGAGPQLYGLAFDPTSGVLYGLDFQGDLYTINRTTGAATLLTTLAFTPTTGTLSLQVDSSGILWIENDGTRGDLWSVDPTATNIAGSAILSGVMHQAATTAYSEALLIKPAATVPVVTTPATPSGPAKADPALAATGTSADFTAGTVTIGGGSVLLGFVLVLLGRRRKLS